MKPRSMSSQIPVAVLALVIVACSSVSGTRENSSAAAASPASPKTIR